MEGAIHGVCMASVYAAQPAPGEPGTDASVAADKSGTAKHDAERTRHRHVSTASNRGTYEVRRRRASR